MGRGIPDGGNCSAEATAAQRPVRRDLLGRLQGRGLARETVVGELERPWKDLGSYFNWDFSVNGILSFSKRFKKIRDTGGGPELNTFDVLW